MVKFLVAFFGQYWMLPQFSRLGTGIYDSQSQKCAESSGFYKCWTDVNISIYTAIYLVVLATLKCLSLEFQQDIYDSVKAVR